MIFICKFKLNKGFRSEIDIFVYVFVIGFCLINLFLFSFELEWINIFLFWGKYYDFCVLVFSLFDISE